MKPTTAEERRRWLTWGSHMMDLKREHIKTNMVDRLIADVERYRLAVLAYGDHSGQCHRTEHPHMHKGVDCDKPHPCDCGWLGIHDMALEKS